MGDFLSGYRDRSGHGFKAKKVKREPLLTVADLAREKGVPYHIAQAKMKLCKLEFVRVKSKKYYQRSELLAFYESVTAPQSALGGDHDRRDDQS